uniref:Integrase, catalytic region, zinc finger, CCHC-type, peptidase aspartic, catalytic n=1 Tax=Tanacetum cinerariifolium TaxID=118510 RepID=A0A699HII6_TANCI|nr:hypothetical protein [Tanacetum cinerariifolium]
MSNQSEDIIAAGSNTRPPMLDRTYFELWKERIRLYCKGKDHGEYNFSLLMKAHSRWDGVEMRLLQGLPKDIYKLINHNTYAKDIWDNVKMLLESSELTKDDRKSQMYNEFEHFEQHKGKNIHDCYVRVYRNNARGDAAASNRGAQYRVAPTAQTMFMANLSSVDPVFDEAGPSYDSDTLSKVHDHDNCLDNMNESHEEHEMHNDVQPNNVVDSDTEYTSNSNIISYEQYVQDNEDQVVHNDVSSVPNDAVMIITNYKYKQDDQCVTFNKPNNTVNASLTTELARYRN